MAVQSELQRALEWASATREQALQVLRKLVSQPSVSARGEGTQQCARLVQQVMEQAGIRTELLETPGQPAVFGELAGPPGRPSVLFYGHYDVQPPEPLELWDSPPFEGTVRDGRIYGRGVADNKGQLLCHVWAVQAWQAVGGPPVTVKFLIEGEEEIGSPHLAELVRRHADRLRADLVFTADGNMLAPTRPTVCFGARGLLYAEVELRGARSDAHSGNNGEVLPQPAWELVWLLSELRGRDGRIRIPGFYERVRTPSPEEVALLEAIPFDRAAFLAEHGLQDSPIRTGSQFFRRLVFEPTFNIAGLQSGYGGPGMKTIIPARAVAKVDFRLVPDQEPEEVFRAFQQAVRARSPQAEVRLIAAVPPSRTDPFLPVSRAAVRAVRESWGMEPVVIPMLGGTLPDYVFTRILGLPSVVVPYANHDERNHAPNENLRLDCFEAGIRTSIHLLAALADAEVATAKRPGP